MTRHGPPDETPTPPHADRREGGAGSASPPFDIAASLRASGEVFASQIEEAATRRAVSELDAKPHPAAHTLSEVTMLLETSRERLVEALHTLPEESQYAPFAARIRAVASNSPELRQILSEVPR